LRSSRGQPDRNRRTAISSPYRSPERPQKRAPIGRPSDHDTHDHNSQRPAARGDRADTLPKLAPDGHKHKVIWARRDGMGKRAIRRGQFQSHGRKRFMRERLANESAKMPNAGQISQSITRSIGTIALKDCARTKTAPPAQISLGPVIFRQDAWLILDDGTNSIAAGTTVATLTAISAVAPEGIVLPLPASALGSALKRAQQRGTSSPQASSPLTARTLALISRAALISTPPPVQFFHAAPNGRIPVRAIASRMDPPPATTEDGAIWCTLYSQCVHTLRGVTTFAQRQPAPY